MVGWFLFLFLTDLSDIMIVFHLLVDGSLDEFLVGLEDLLLRGGERVDHRLQLMNDRLFLVQILFPKTVQFSLHIMHVLFRPLETGKGTR